MCIQIQDTRTYICIWREKQGKTYSLWIAKCQAKMKKALAKYKNKNT